MRLWSIHPKYLDPQGLVALWREALLARAVLRDQTSGYRHHPQLHRFRAHPAPRRAISAYLHAVYLEASRRGYSFDATKIGNGRTRISIPVTRGQVAYEWAHLRSKLRSRNPAWYRQWRSTRLPQCHPLMRARAGQREHWERPRAPRSR